MQVKTETPASYVVTPAASCDDAIISQALAILDSRIRSGPVFASPADVKTYLRLYFAKHTENGREAFAVCFLDSQNRLIDIETMFMGTLTQTAVYPREILRRAIVINAAAVILAHNHPSGAAEPSRADEHLTQTCKAALQLADIKVLDHMVVGDTIVSFAERGLI